VAEIESPVAQAESHVERSVAEAIGLEGKASVGAIAETGSNGDAPIAEAIAWADVEAIADALPGEEEEAYVAVAEAEPHVELAFAETVAETVAETIPTSAVHLEAVAEHESDVAPAAAEAVAPAEAPQPESQL